MANGMDDPTRGLDVGVPSNAIPVDGVITVCPYEAIIRERSSAFVSSSETSSSSRKETSGERSRIMSVGSGSGERSALTSSSHPPLNLCSESFAFVVVVVVLGASVLAASVCCSWNLALRLRSSSSMEGTAAASMPSSVNPAVFFNPPAARMDLYDILPSNGTDMALNANPSSSSTVTASRVVEGGFTADASNPNSTPSEPSFEV